MVRWRAPSKVRPTSFTQSRKGWRSPPRALRPRGRKLSQASFSVSKHSRVSAVRTDLPSFRAFSRQEMTEHGLPGSKARNSVTIFMVAVARSQSDHTAEKNESVWKKGYPYM